MINIKQKDKSIMENFLESRLSNEYREISLVLDILGDKYKNKLPKAILETIEKKQNIDYKPDVSIANPRISHKALTILSILYLKYWLDDENEKAYLRNIYRENE